MGNNGNFWAVQSPFRTRPRPGSVPGPEMQLFPEEKALRSWLGPGAVCATEYGGGGVRVVDERAP